MRSTSTSNIPAEGRRNNRKRGKVFPAFLGSSSNPLALPRMQASIPNSFSCAENADVWAKAALLWLEAGYIEDESSASTLEMVTHAFEKWVNQFTGILKHLEFNIRLNTKEIWSEFAYEKFESAEMLEQKGLFISITSGDTTSFSLQNKLEEIAKESPELAETALHWVGLAGARVLQIFTPWMGWGMASYTWWFGMETQEEFWEEAREYWADVPAEEIDVVSPDDWDAVFPKWVTCPGEKLKPQALKKLGKNSTLPYIKALTDLLSDIAINEHAQLGNLEMVNLLNIYHGAYLFWNHGDPLGRLLDDRFQGINEGIEGYVEMFAISYMPFEQSKFLKWKMDMEQAFMQIQRIDQLIDMIGTPF